MTLNVAVQSNVKVLLRFQQEIYSVIHKEAVTRKYILQQFYSHTRHMLPVC